MKKTDFILDDLCSKIYSLVLKDKKLPTQMELAETYGCSRFTIQKVLKEMELLGIVEIIQGSGVYISEELPNKPIIYNSIMRTPYTEIQSRVLEMKVMTADRKLAGLMNLKENTKVWEFLRLRTVHGYFSMLEQSGMPYEKFADMTQADLEDSIQNYVRKKGFTLLHMVKNNTAVSLTKEEAVLLYCRRGTPAIEIITRGVLEGGEIYEYSRGVAPGYSCMYILPFDEKSFEYRRYGVKEK